jgi:hypothetical protein
VSTLDREFQATGMRVLSNRIDIDIAIGGVLG